jgi:hypothetical protein
MKGWRTARTLLLVLTASLIRGARLLGAPRSSVTLAQTLAMALVVLAPSPMVWAGPAGQVTVNSGSVIGLQGTPHLFIGDANGVLHWGGDTRALATIQGIDWNNRRDVSLDVLRSLRRGDPYLSAGLVKIGDPIYLVKWETNQAQPLLLHIQSISDVELFGINAANYGAFVQDKTTWEQKFGLSTDPLVRRELAPATAQGATVQGATVQGATATPAIWLAIGQSNLENASAGWPTAPGAAQVRVRRRDYQTPSGDIPSWTSLADLGTFPAVPGAFGMELAARLGTGPLFVQANAVSGSPLSCWTPGAPCYENQVRPFIPGVKGIIWWQGESDAGDFASAGTYETRLRSVFAAFRQQAGSPNVPIVLVTLQTFCTNWVNGVPQATCTEPSWWGQVREAQRAVASSDPCVASIDAQPYTHGEVHPSYFYSQAGALLADAAVRLAYSSTSGCS